MVNSRFAIPSSGHFKFLSLLLCKDPTSFGCVLVFQLVNKYFWNEGMDFDLPRRREKTAKQFQSPSVQHNRRTTAEQGLPLRLFNSKCWRHDIRSVRLVSSSSQCRPHHFNQSQFLQRLQCIARMVSSVGKLSKGAERNR